MQTKSSPRSQVAPSAVHRQPFRAAFLATALLGLALAVPASAQETPGEKAIKYRKAIYQVILWNLGPMSAMAQEKAPYAPEEFAKRAERVNAMSYMLTEAYPPESASGAETRAKAAIWQNRDDFEAKLAAFEQKSAELADISQAGDFAASRAAFFDMANTCKNCHDEYRSD
ncbi:MAG TPA: cytochrome c [Steroidobacteraceae bacterium]|nr:cytochrome c [Steroidobacteraceae bacterium]